ncbi:MAG: FAD-linked oxidase C-terminal domain-containing protein, partial [Desulfobacterales bacterium]|nr:FAD-linked oxidase C-terminal domain-containing protein [Desulfobacterales bacterium]
MNTVIPRDLIKNLRRIVGERHVAESRTTTELYSYDGSMARGKPGAVVFPGDAVETAAVIKEATRAGVPFVPRGFGTNLSGGTVLPYGGLTICLARLNRILGIFPDRRTAVVQPGVTNLELQNALAPLGFFYAPDPASQKVATLGGNVGENSGGPRCLRYGVTTNHVIGLQVILADGQILRLGSAAYDPSGYDLRGLLIGSEGTLAVVTEVTVRIMPTPEKVITQLAVYNDVADAARSVADIIAAGIVPATLEMMDARIIQAVEDSYTCGYPRDAAAVLIIEVEGPAVGLEEQARNIRAICTANHCREIRDAATAAERNRLWEGRRGAFGAVARLAPNYLVNDCTVPRTLLPEALAQVATIVKAHGFVHGNVFHAGDGNLHPLLLFDSRDADQLKRVHEAGWQIMKACVALGGTISGEHGIGREKMEAMRLVFSDEDIDAQRSLQDAFDPTHVVNPGKIFPDTSQPFAFKDQAAWSWPGDLLTPAEKGIAEQVQQALATGHALVPSGSGSLGDFGNLPARPGLPLKTDALCALLDLDPSNQYVTVEAGMTLGDIQKALAPHNQWIALRPAFGLLRRTIGGITAMGACGPERFSYGAPRELLLGLRFIDGRGRLIRAGGKVVKNVAGYDMTRLLAGSAGTLGLITRVTLRTATCPQRCAAISATGTLDACANLATLVLGSSLGAVFAAAVPETGSTCWRMRLGFEGFRETVASQLAQAQALLAGAGFSSERTDDYDVWCGPFAEMFTAIAGHPYALRAGTPPDLVAAASQFIARQGPAVSILVDFGCGRILAGIDRMTDGSWKELCRQINELEGHVVLEKAPDEFKQRNDVFGPPRPEWNLMHRIKAILDPKHLFAPGRMPG